MDLKSRIRFFFHKHSKKLKRTEELGWVGLSVLIFHENLHAEPKRFRINYFVLLFMLGLFLVLPLFSLGLYLESYWDTTEETRKLETRYKLLEISMGLTLEKKELFHKLEKQLFHFDDTFSFQNKHSLRELLKFTTSLEEKRKIQESNFLRENEAIPQRFHHELQFLLPLRAKMKELVNYQLPFIFRPIWNRLRIYHLTPRGWTLLGGIGHVTSLYGNRQNPIEGGTEFHAGVDFAYAEGTPIVATAPGYVIRAVQKPDSGYGKYVRIHHGFGFTSLYAHCKDLNVQEGEFVERGQVIAYIGRTGRTTGYHLHYEIQLGLDVATDPIHYVKLK